MDQPWAPLVIILEHLLVLEYKHALKKEIPETITPKNNRNKKVTYKSKEAECERVLELVSRKIAETFQRLITKT